MNMNLFSLKGKKCMVTGAASGIGQSIAIGLAEAGADVACLDVQNGENMELTIKGIESFGSRGIKLIGDITNSVFLEQALDEIIHQFSGLDVAVNSAGISSICHAEEIEEDDWDKTIGVNLKGTFLSCKAQAKRMMLQKQGSIVNFAGVTGVVADYYIPQAHYNCTMAGIINLSKNLALEWGKCGIRVNTISPGPTFTPMQHKNGFTKQHIRYEETSPMIRMANSLEMVGPTIFLASDASSYCTGANLLVDGGYACK